MGDQWDDTYPVSAEDFTYNQLWGPRDKKETRGEMYSKRLFAAPVANKYTRPEGRGHVEIRKQGDWWYMECHAPHAMPVVHQSKSWYMALRLADSHIRWHQIMSTPRPGYYK